MSKKVVVVLLRGSRRSRRRSRRRRTEFSKFDPTTSPLQPRHTVIFLINPTQSNKLDMKCGNIQVAAPGPTLLNCE